MSQVPVTELTAAGLPRSSTTRFALLMLMICAASSFAAYWWLVAERGDWTGEQNACLVRLGHADAAGGGVNAFNDCINRVALLQEGAVLLGPCTVIMLSLLIAYASVPVLLRLWGPRAPRARAADRFEACLAESGSRRQPRLVTVKRGASGEARVFGMYPRYWVVADPLLVAGSDGQLAAMFRHELAHLRAGDVDRARLARTVWGVFFVFVAPALTISIAAQGGAAWTAMGLRLLVLLVLVHLTYLSLLRAREHEADLLADAPRSRPVPGSGTPPLAAVLAGQSRRRRYRSFLPTFLPTFLLAHPTPAQRVAALGRPQLTARLSVLEFLSTGIAAGVIFQELAFAVGAVMPGTQEVAYWITGAIVAVPVCAVTIAALWRHCLAGPGPLRRSTVMAAGSLLGAGLLAGSQLSPRAAADWEMVRMTISPVLPSNLSLSVIGLRGVAALALVVMAGSALFMLWAAAFARELNAESRRPHAWQRRMSTGLAVAVLAVPLGALFAMLRLAGDSMDGQQGTAIADLLQGRLLLLGLAATAAAALIFLLAAAMIRGKRAAPRQPVISRTASIWCAAAVLIPAAAWCAGAAVQHSVTPGTPVAATGNGALPLLPPAVTSGTGPISPGIMCTAMPSVPQQDQADPATWRQIGGLLQRTPDQQLDFLGGELVRAAGAPPALGGSLAASTWLAAGFRCLLLLSTPSGAP